MTISAFTYFIISITSEIDMPSHSIHLRQCLITLIHRQPRSYHTAISLIISLFSEGTLLAAYFGLPANLSEQLP
jgi:hypothetical protein